MKKLLLIALTLLSGFSTAQAGELLFVEARHSGKCLHVTNASQENGAAVTQWDCIDKPNVKLEELPAGDGYVFLRFVHSGKCLHVSNGSQENAAPITQWDCIDKPNVKIRKKPAGEGYFHLSFQHSGKCVHQANGVQNNGGAITQWDCIDKPNVLWRIRPVSPPAAVAAAASAPDAQTSAVAPLVAGAAVATPVLAANAADKSTALPPPQVLSRFEARQIDDAVFAYISKRVKDPVVKITKVQIEGVMGEAVATVEGRDYFRIFLKKKDGNWAGIFDGAIGPGDCEAMGFPKSSKICGY